MNNRNPIILSLLLTFIFSVSSIAADTKIVSHPGKYNDYYHIKFTLTANKIIAIPAAAKTDAKKSAPKFKDGGQFEITIIKNQFPIHAPNCDASIKLRMPWTNPNVEKSASFIEEKRFIFNKIRTLMDGSNESIDVIIELNPYVKLLSKEPLKIQLTKCIVFFRHAHSRYIDYTGALKK